MQIFCGKEGTSLSDDGQERARILRRALGVCRRAGKFK
jgi:hypothetical protein